MKRFLVAFLYLAWGILVVALPLAGGWLASSLAAYGGSRPWLAALVALLLFPILPLAWEAWATRRPAAKRFLTFWDRLALRTLAINALFLVVTLATHASTAFAALATRGDWMLEGQHGATAEATRGALFTSAQSLEWLYVATHPNPYAIGDPDPAPPSADPPPATDPVPAPDPIAAQPADPPPDDTPPARVDDAAPKPALHPLAVDTPPEAEKSIAALGAFIAAHEPDPFQRAKAVHDWIADRVAYDGVARRTQKFPPQDAQTVFRTRKAVCAGYARLFTALARAAGLEAAYVLGDARDPGLRPEGEAHAWNTVKIAGSWHLVDVTWDSGYLDGDAFVKQYRTSYFLTPPEIFGVDHYPRDAHWQLRAPPITRGAFLRQPLDRAASHVVA
jgi:hypothetical protein